MVLLIPRRIKQLKEEGRAEARAEARAQGVREGFQVGRAEGVQMGHAEGFQEGRAEGIEEGRAEERELVARILALYDRGEITDEQLYTLLSFRNILERDGG